MQLLWNFVGRRLGLKNLADYGQARQVMLGLTNLSIRTVLDIGANRGRHTRMYRRKFPQAQIVAIEPIPHLAARIEKWAATQRGKVQVLPLAISSSPGEREFFINRKSSIWSTLRIPDGSLTSEYDSIAVQVETLDNLAAQHHWENEILVKSDTEGFDLEVLRGGENFLRRAAAMIIEAPFYPTPYGTTAPVFEEIVAKMQELGYAYRGNIRCCWNQGVCVGADAVFVRREVAHRLAA